MVRSIAVSFGALAMALVVLRGAILGDPAADVAVNAIIALVVFAGVGAVVGWIADYLVRDSLETLFRKRVEWYEQGLIDAGYLDGDSSEDA